METVLPPCTDACPVKTDVRGYLSAIAERDYLKAYYLIKEHNPFPAVCAWICPHPCEGSCRRGAVDEPLAIRDLKRFAVEKGRETWKSPKNKPGKISPPYPLSQKVAVIGAGPAGLTAAYDLACKGYPVTVYEKYPAPGGQFFSSLPAYRLPAAALTQDLEDILACGMEIKAGVEVGKDISFQELYANYQALVISVGLSMSRKLIAGWKPALPLPEFDHPEVWLALPFLQAVKQGKSLKLNKNVLVIGGGGVALDVARTAIRVGAEKVSLICLEKREEMVAPAEEIEEALKEGVQIIPGYGPKKILFAGGKITGMEIKKVHSIYDQNGNFNPVFFEDKTNIVPGATIILAIGQTTNLSFLEDSPIKLNENGWLTADKNTLATSLAGVFACGEVVAGAGPAISAIASGHRAADSVHSYLQNHSFSFNHDQQIKVIGSLPLETAKLIPPFTRQKIWSFDTFGKYVYEERAAVTEAHRCLSCGLGAEIISTQCSLCINCLRVCPYHAPVGQNQLQIPPENCLACGLCASVCPSKAITLKGLPENEVLALLQPLPPAQDPALAIFICRHALAKANLPLDFKLMPGFKNSCLIKLPSVGALKLFWLLAAIENGFAGVIVISCPKPACQHSGSLNLAENQVKRAKEIYTTVGINPARLLFLSSEETALTTKLTAFAGQLKSLAPKHQPASAPPLPPPP
jgi:NADPH-dependent glutamate synthase beta subunit-like oxidoreductase/coenzyme F420-reducing hydrogenase delta subunit/ferredoxin